MSVGNFFNKTIIIRRLKVSAGNKRSYFATATADASISKQEKTNSRESDITTSDIYVGFFEDTTNINEGDMIQDKYTSTKYRVIGKETFELGINQYYKVLLEKTNV
jgi:hypothetical protein